ncbi:ABC transporter ATP-binding protein [Halocalculus aciditolerans]|uniref:Nickel import system ATP-binding protein NikD n=1 Tax=Halocalculus aciditolerans TaxID=1383812 RepID=A0A830FF68_9EURY|nr:oligopeptide/dipeptide ABC transporter ATP-binding protein [Halocalculus aciditolerans]GGL47239.1 ABC transporter ATP-binding protein [Halocalculus aciditolerans]
MSQTTQVSRDARGDEDPLLSVQDLQTVFYTDKETIRAVDGVSYDIYRGETVGIVGESGSGKSVTARSIMGLVDSPGRIERGRIEFRDLDTVRRCAKKFSRHTVDLTDVAEGEIDDAIAERADDDDFIFVEERDGDGNITRGFVDTSSATEDQMRSVRGSGIAMVFQDPLTSLNPVYTVGNQIVEAIELHQDLSGKAAEKEAIQLLEDVGIPDAKRRLDEYPHQFSGGMRQRAVIAMALACDPELLICDEPTTALDVTIQAQILELLEDLQDERDLGIMFITHDMGVIAEIADRVNVMYAGEVVERAPVVELFDAPKHPYTEGLLSSIPGRNPGAERLSTIEGDVETPNSPATSCRFAARCPKAFAECEAVHPASVSVTEDSAVEHTARCLLYPDDVGREEAVELHRSRSNVTEDSL